MGSGFPQFYGDQPHSTFALRQTEPALYFHTLALITVILSLVSGFVLPGTPQRRTREPNPVCLAIVKILTVSVDVVSVILGFDSFCLILLFSLHLLYHE